MGALASQAGCVRKGCLSADATALSMMSCGRGTVKTKESNCVLVGECLPGGPDLPRGDGLMWAVALRQFYWTTTPRADGGSRALTFLCGPSS